MTSIRRDFVANNCTSLKHRRMVVIRGTQYSAEKAEYDLTIFLYGGDGIAVSKITIAGIIIG